MEADFQSSKVRSTDWKKLSFAIVGLGLIGGSYAKALRLLGAKQILGMEHNEATLAQAQAMGIIDVGMTAVDERLAQADVVICAIYPEAIASFIKSNVEHFKADVLITDVAGIKNNMIAEVQAALSPGMEFISGHPMAGRQSSGLGMAEAAIFHNANYIIVPEKGNSEAAICWLETFAKALGCKNTVRVTPEEHDRTIAFTSNLPHVTAVALMDSASYNEKTKYFVAGSFRDGTRVADINPELWCALFLANKDKVADEIEKYMEQLELWRKALRAGDGETMKELMRTSAARRKELY
ncbi:MAG: prephenate dehydrogenase [Phascolarctobacterium sp.]|nr:prephenate dehydrogenase [Phascolarctobacterium sp.]